MEAKLTEDNRINLPMYRVIIEDEGNVVKVYPSHSEKQYAVEFAVLVNMIEVGHLEEDLAQFKMKLTLAEQHQQALDNMLGGNIENLDELEDD